MDEEFTDLRIAVAGVGGAGCNTINRLARFDIPNAKLMAFNTDKKHLSLVSDKAEKFLIGGKLTRGLGAGGFPEVAEKAALMSRAEIEKALYGVDLLFLSAGMGGGTGTGASPVIAEIARDAGAMVVCFVTTPFKLEGSRIGKAREGCQKLRAAADTVVIIDNNRLHAFAPNLQIEKAFELADEIISRAVSGITKTVFSPSLINLDFADLKTVVEKGGVGMIAVGEAHGYDRVNDVVKDTLTNRLLDVECSGAKGVLLEIIGGNDLTLGDVNSVGELMTELVDEDANVVWGARAEPGNEGKIEVIAIFTGVSAPTMLLK
jgi:cell division protein FtsZ